MCVLCVSVCVLCKYLVSSVSQSLSLSFSLFLSLSLSLFLCLLSPWFMGEFPCQTSTCRLVHLKTSHTSSFRPSLRPHTLVV
jgi:hypothetical protein